jgi:SNF2 family DNA or RNA helicase
MRIRPKKRNPASWYRNKIAQSAIVEFLSRPREDWTWVKQVPKAEAMQILHRNYGVTFHTEPMAHQAACLLLALSQPQFMFLLDMGTGKTKIMLDAARHRTRSGLAQRTLVLVPSAINVDGWQQEIKTHAPDLSVVPLMGDRAERERLIEFDADVYLLTYPGLQVYTTELDKQRHARVIDRKRLIAFAQRFDSVVFDESHLVGNRQTLTYKACRAISNHAKYRYGNTGTAFGRDPTMLWSQFDLIDHGETLGETLGLFRAAFFTQKENFWSGGVDYEFNHGMDDELNRLLRHRSIRYEDTECGDLPPKTYTKILIKFPSEIEVHCQKLRDQMRAAFGNYREMENAFLRMRQLSSGFMSLRSDDDKVEVEFEVNPKLNALRELLQQIPAGKKVLVFHEFNYSGQLICNMLKAEGIKHAWIRGDKEQTAAISKFRDDPTCTVGVQNINVGKGTGTNQQHAKYMIFYESPVSPILRKQGEKRIHRKGQTEHVYFYDLVVQGTYDARILDFLKEGKDLFESIVNGGAPV